MSVTVLRVTLSDIVLCSLHPSGMRGMTNKVYSTLNLKSFFVFVSSACKSTQGNNKVFLSAFKVHCVFLTYRSIISEYFNIIPFISHTQGDSQGKLSMSQCFLSGILSMKTILNFKRYFRTSVHAVQIEV